MRRCGRPSEWLPCASIRSVRGVVGQSGARGAGGAGNMNAAEISRLLAQDIYALVRTLLPNGRRIGPEWVCGLIYGEQGKSGKVHLTAEKAGVWADFATDTDKGDALDLVKAVNRCDTRAALAWAHSWLGVADGPPGDRGRTIVYPYVDEAGALLFEVCKKEQPKRFWQQQPDGKGGYKRDENGKLTMKGARYVPYHLDRLVAARQNANGHPPRVYICEGEKDADNVATVGFLTTTNAGGASLSRGRSKWRSDYNQVFAGFDVVILPDNDEAGRIHAQHVAANVAPVAHAVRIVELPGLPEKGDVTDWIHPCALSPFATSGLPTASISAPRTKRPSNKPKESGSSKSQRCADGAKTMWIAPRLLCRAPPTEPASPTATCRRKSHANASISAALTTSNFCATVPVTAASGRLSASFSISPACEEISINFGL